jgi:hypothetical protein
MAYRGRMPPHVRSERGCGRAEGGLWKVESSHVWTFQWRRQAERLKGRFLLVRAYCAPFQCALPVDRRRGRRTPE